MGLSITWLLAYGLMLSLQFISIGSIDQKGSGNYDSGMEEIFFGTL